MSNFEVWGYTVSAFVIGAISGVVHSALRNRGESAQPAEAPVLQWPTNPSKSVNEDLQISEIWEQLKSSKYVWETERATITISRWPFHLDEMIRNQYGFNYYVMVRLTIHGYRFPLVGTFKVDNHIEFLHLVRNSMQREIQNDDEIRSIVDEIRSAMRTPPPSIHDIDDKTALKVQQ